MGGLSVGDECVSSITFQYPIPAPVKYFRSYFPRVRRTKDMQNCLPMIAAWATLNDNSFSAQPFADAEKYALDFATKLDTNGNGKLELPEVRRRFGGDQRRSAE